MSFNVETFDYPSKAALPGSQAVIDGTPADVLRWGVSRGIRVCPCLRCGQDTYKESS